ncbi:PAS domain S-box protein [Actimicrobium sp. CCI2.3]|uniref:PAS domain S-box protein n=1 Tax=Actimicrobium sp. CCI2.3 TaxID=3048616 RepID=UPI002AB4969F|nr:PAS domain S-box protein [Actimicrobium sp. CCI2.3]MDY7574681.1 PAS domain S-box protein [Actimicrobium sp. CCI2.3]MEB0020362.1 PAS domain S-box protein [Actimicrobium sp. CCI2.3]
MTLHPGILARLLARFHLQILLPVLGLLTLTLLWTVIFFQLQDSRSVALEEASSQAEALSQDYADHSARLLRQIDQATQFVKFAYEQRQQSFRLDELVKRKGVMPADLMLGVTISDANGNGVAGVHTPGLDDISDRDYFKVHAQADDDKLYISRALLEAYSTQWSIIVSRRLNRPDGSFAGIVAITLNQSFLSAYLPSRTGPKTFVGLLGDDGIFRAGRIGPTPFAGGDQSFASWIKPASKTGAVTLVRDSPFDHVRRIFSFQQLNDFPLVSLVGIDEQSALAPYYRSRVSTLWSGAVGSLGLLFFFAILMRQSARLRISELAASQAQTAFRAAAEGSLDALTILQSHTDSSGTISDFAIQAINKRGASLLKRDQEDLIGQLLCSVVPGTRSDGFLDKYLHVVRSGIPMEEEFQIITSNGGQLWLRQQVVPINGGLAVTTRDISARKEAELETRNNRAFLQSLIDNLPLAVYARDMRGASARTIVWNETAEKITGYSSEMVLGHDDEAIFPTEIRSTFNHFEVRMAANPTVLNLPDVPFRSRGGELHCLRIIAVPLLDDSGKLEYILGIAEDITVSRRQEMALRSKQAELAAANDASPLGLFRTDPDGNCTYVNRTYEEMSGLTAAQAIGDGWVKAIHPEDRLKVFQAWGHASGEHASYQGAYRFRHDNGRIVWVSMKTAPIVVDGAVEGYVGSVDDITVRRKSEQALSKSEQRLRNITDKLPALVAFVDAEQRFRFNNLAYQHAFGINRDDIKYQTIREFVGEEQYAVMSPYLQRALRGETVTFEHEEGSDENNRWAEATYIPQLGDDGKEVVGIHMMMHDITEKKHEQSRLLQLAQVDSLTGLLNRAGFESKLALALAGAREKQHMVALLYLDIDHFKSINDTHGHLVGDALLRAFSGRLSRALRSVDTIARLGGDEFTVIMERITHTDDAEKTAGKIVDSMRALFKLDDLPLSITASIGVAFCPGIAMNADDLIRQADEMLYQAKASGRNQYCVKLPDH